MKKSYLLMAAAATIFAACSETDLVNPVYEAQNEIGFDNHVGKTTRAEITKVDDLKGEDSGFVVWGYKTSASTPNWETATEKPIFNGVRVYHDGSKWTYDLKKYWDKTAVYNFYAVAPYTEDAQFSIDEDATAATGYITIDQVASAPAATAIDYLIDRDGNTEVSGTSSTAPHPTVDFDFHHIMAKVTLQLVCGDINENDKITVTELTMTGWDSGKGKFVQTLAATPSETDNIDEWTIATSGDGKAEYKDLTHELSDKPVQVGSYIMVPQDVEILTFTLNYTITYSNGTTEDFVAHVGELEDQTWGTDSWTTYTLTVGPQPIEFDVTSVNGFTNECPTEENPNPGDLPIE